MYTDYKLYGIKYIKPIKIVSIVQGNSHGNKRVFVFLRTRPYSLAEILSSRIVQCVLRVISISSEFSFFLLKNAEVTWKTNDIQTPSLNVFQLMS